MRQIAVKIFIIIFITALLTFLQCQLSGKRKTRSRQATLPFVGFGYCLIMLIVGIKFWKKVAAQFAGLFGFRDQVLGVLSKLGQFGSGLTGLVDKYVRLDTIGFVVLMNLLVLLAYLIIKPIARGITRLTFIGDKNPRYISSHFYEFDEDYNEWFLMDKWVNVRQVLGWVTIVAVIAAGDILGIMFHFGTTSDYYGFFFPVFAIIILAEMFSFLNGYTKEEFEHEVLGDDSFSQRISNFNKVQSILQKRFEHELLTSATKSDYSTTASPAIMIKQLAQSEFYEDRIAAKFFELNRTPDPYNADCILATTELLKGQNVVFLNPFYHDLERYIALPFINTLLRGKKCLVIVGRSSITEDLTVWLPDVLHQYARIKSLWRVAGLNGFEPNCEVGILTASQLYDLSLLDANREFLGNVDFVLLLEPSLIINTAQMGFGILSKEMEADGSKPTYCICDRIVDGLVDTMSHLLQSEITHVVAPPVTKNLHTAMTWDADGDFLRQKLFGKEIRYLGNGMEIGAVALRNQIPHVYWYGETKVPLRDIKWIAGQYYPVLCKYMNMPAQQKSIYDNIDFITNIWCSDEKNEEFLIAEDEFINMFATVRTFLSRGKEQSFVNVLSETYLLRDYMRCNPQMFETAANAIPSLAPAYAKTERNTLIKLLLTMAFRPVYESEIVEEFRLVGIATEDANNKLGELLKKYYGEDEHIYTVTSQTHGFSGVSRDLERMFEINIERFHDRFGTSLENAYFVCEEEETETEYLDAKLMNHVTQLVLPGQYVVYDGKYYMVHHISKDSGVIMHRASNQFTGRKYYRQIRNYEVKSENPTILHKKTVMDIAFTRLMMDFTVTTPAYLEMKRFDDLRTARKIDLSEDPDVKLFDREYKNKQVITMELPNSDEKIRFTLCMLLMETMKTIFPNAWQYIAITSKLPEETDGFLNYTIYGLSGHVKEECIYIFEDSEIDLGLLDAIEKNMMQFLEIVTDYLCWHMDKMLESEAQDPPIFTEEYPNPSEEYFHLPTGSDAEEDLDEIELKLSDEAVAERVKDRDFLAHATMDETTNSVRRQLKDRASTRYQETCYLKFGFDEISPRIKVERLKQYLTARGFYNNDLTKARLRDTADCLTLDFEIKNCCDFCCRPISGVSYERLSDGRVRCNDCGANAIKQVDEFKQLFHQNLQMMENFFEIDFKVPIRVRTIDARKMAKMHGSIFKPTKEFAARVTGLAKKEKGVFSMYIENGSPRLAAIMTVVHELTHIWQYVNWNQKDIKKAFPEKERQDILYEGMAVWASIQYLYLIGEDGYAKEQEQVINHRKDIYGLGFRQFRDRFGIQKDFSMIKESPFKMDAITILENRSEETNLSESSESSESGESNE